MHNLLFHFRALFVGISVSTERYPVVNFFSQSLLSICLEDYWAAYDKSGYVSGGFFHLAYCRHYLREEGTYYAYAYFHLQ